MYRIDSVVVSAYRTNCYALTNEGGTIIVDPGDQASFLQQWTQDLDVIGIVLTHCHCDHIGAVNELVAQHGCWVACGAADVAGTRDLHLSGFDAEGIDYVVDHVDRSLKEGDVIEWGSDRLEVIDTPGHTQGHICLIDRANSILFSGDMLFAGTIGRTDFPGGDQALMASSCAKLAEITQDLRVLPGHGPATTLAAEKSQLRHWARVLCPREVAQDTARNDELRLP